MLRRSTTLPWTLLLFVCMAAGCSTGDASPASGSTSAASELSGRLVLTGSSTVAPLASEIAVRFEERHPDVRVDVQTGGSSRGIADTLSGVADIGLASRNLAADEQQLRAHQVAIDGICLIVHRDNPIESLTREQVTAIYLGEVEFWSQVGGGDEEIVVVNKAEGRGTLEAFCNHFEVNNSDIQADVVVGDNQHGIKTVAGNPQAIGYVSIGTAEYEAEQGTGIRLLAADGVPASRETVVSGEYPLTRPLLFVTSADGNLLADAFLEFALSPEVDDLIEAQSFVPPQR